MSFCILFIGLIAIAGISCGQVDGAPRRFVPQENRDLAVALSCSSDCLPTSYSSALLVSDIDDTIRSLDASGLVLQQAISGAEDLLSTISSQKVPILYLTAGFIATLPLNIVFLNGLPKGTLINSLSWNPFRTATEQAAYKSGVLSNVKSTYPQAKLFCLGDNKYGDPVAYAAYCNFIYIRDVSSSPLYPANFSGYIFTQYNSTTKAKVNGDLSAVFAQSAAASSLLWPNVAGETMIFVKGTSASSSSSSSSGSSRSTPIAQAYFAFATIATLMMCMSVM